MEAFSALLALCAGFQRSLVNSHHKGQWRGTLMSSLICAWTNGWVNNRDACDLRRRRARYSVIVVNNYAHSSKKSIRYAWINLLITMTSKWGRCRLKSPASPLFTQPFIQTQIKENIKAPHHWPLCGDFNGTGEFPAQMASNAENVSIWWRRHEKKNPTTDNINKTKHNKRLHISCDVLCMPYNVHICVITFWWYSAQCHQSVLPSIP